MQVILWKLENVDSRKEQQMEVKKGDNITKIPGWVIAAGIATVGAIVADICRTVEKTHK